MRINLCLALVAVACGSTDEPTGVTLDTPTDTGAAPALVELTIEGPSATVERGSTLSLTLVAAYADGSELDRTAAAEWVSSDVAVASVEAGEVQAHREGPVEITAALDGLRASLPLTVVCTYPATGTGVAFGEPLPALSWTNAVFPGSPVTTGPLDLEDAYCGRDGLDAYDSIFVQVSSEWCTPCRGARSYYLENQSIFDENRSLPLFVEVENEVFERVVTSLDAHESMSRELGSAFGIRVGDLDTEPANGVFTATFLDGPATAWPTSMVVRRSDMKVVALSVDQTSAFVTNLPEILANLDWNWQDIENPVAP